MKNCQIKQTEVGGSINKKYYRTSPAGGGVPKKKPYPLLTGLIYKGTVYMFMMNMI